MDERWNETGVHSFTRARYPKSFVKQHVAPLLEQSTHPSKSNQRRPAGKTEEIFQTERDFWAASNTLTFETVRLNGFRISDWFPRAPGVYWSKYGMRARENVYGGHSIDDPKLGTIFEPQGKMALVEEGGVGTIRLRPRRRDSTDCWFATAVEGAQCAGGIPLLIPNGFIRENAIEWGDTANIIGTVRFLHDADLSDVAASVHHASPMIVFVEELEAVTPKSRSQGITITPVALFDLENSLGSGSRQPEPSEFGYTFVQSNPNDAGVTAGADWIESYAEKFGGKVLTNFDEQVPMLADAPLSYQRLVNKTYDRAVIKYYHLEKLADRIDTLKTEYVNYGQVGAMGEGARSVDSVLNGRLNRGKGADDKKSQ